MQSDLSASDVSDSLNVPHVRVYTCSTPNNNPLLLTIFSNTGVVPCSKPPLTAHTVRIAENGQNLEVRPHSLTDLKDTRGITGSGLPTELWTPGSSPSLRDRYGDRVVHKVFFLSPSWTSKEPLQNGLQPFREQDKSSVKEGKIGRTEPPVFGNN